MTARRALRSALYEGHIMHARLAPTRNVFRYRVLMARIDLDELPLLDATLWPVFGHNRRALSGIDDAEYLDSEPSIRAGVLATVAGAGMQVSGDERITMVTGLRVAGYAFNPLTLLWVHDRAADTSDDDPIAVVAEVHNTFGDRYRYVLSGEESTPGGAAGHSTWTRRKQMHVSPFMPMQQDYRFRIGRPGSRFFCRLDVLDDDNPFHATWTGHEVSLTRTSLTSALARHPLMPMRTTALIHWQALRLWLGRVPVHRRPPAGHPTEGAHAR